MMQHIDTPDIDAALDKLLARTPRGMELTQEEIAQACGLSRGRIWQIEQAALRKLRRNFLRKYPGAAYADELLKLI